MNTVEVDRGCFACILGGDDGLRLSILAAQWRGFEHMFELSGSGMVTAVDAPAPAAGRPSERPGSGAGADSHESPRSSPGVRPLSTVVHKRGECYPQMLITFHSRVPAWHPSRRVASERGLPSAGRRDHEANSY